MRLAFSTVVMGLMAACATGETPGDDPLLDGGSGGSGAGTPSTGGSPPGGSSSSGGSSSGSVGTSGSGTGGTFPNGGTFPSGGIGFGGTGFTAGTGGVATGGGGAATGGGGAGGAGGAPAGGGGAGGKAGAGGTGGAPAVGCPAKTTWTATASVHAMDCPTPDDTGPYCGPPERAVDGVTTNRFSTGTARLGTEWLQIDFGKVVTVSKVTLVTANGSTDYTLAYEVRMSNNAGDIAGTASLVSGAGMQGTTTITLPTAKTGRYLRINQTMAMAGWWSVAEVNVDCQ